MLNRQLPNYWTLAKLGETCQTTSGGTPSRKNKTFYEGKIPWVKSGELNYNVIYDSEEHISEEAIRYSSAKIFPKGTLLIALYGATIGKLAFLGTESASNQAVCAIFKNETFESKFLFYYLFHKKNELVQQGIGGAQPNISQTILKNLLTPIAPLPEQRAIVAKIEQLFSELDNGIANLKAAREKLKIYRQAVLKKAFEGELTREWRAQQKDLPTADQLLEQIKAERKAYYQQQLKAWQQTVITWDAQGRKGKKSGKPKQNIEWNNISEIELENLSVLPRQWFWIKIKDIAIKITDGEHITPKRTDEGFYLLSARNIQNGYIDYSNVDYVGKDEFERIRKRCNPEYGDILISCSGSVGRISHVPKNSEFVMVRSVALVKTNSKIFHYKFLEYLLQSPVLQSQIEKGKKATAQANLFLGPIGNLNVVACSLEEQHQIVQEIETRLSVCDKLAASIEESLEKAEALRQSILKKAFEGKLLSEAELEACRQAPDWEPAGQLLNRIKGRKEPVQGKLFEV